MQPEAEIRKPRSEIRKNSEVRSANCATRRSRLSAADSPSAHHVSRFTFHARQRAFTLIEIMIVVGIMGIIMTMGVPLVYKVWHKEPMTKAVSEVVEVCSHARARAIMQGREVDVIFRPVEGSFSLGSAPAPAGPGTAGAPAGGGGSEAGMTFSISGGSGTAGQFDKSIMIYMLDIGKQPHDFKDDEQAVVRFFPNGTCDELTLVIGTDPINTCQIRLEVTTGLASVEYNARKYR